MIKNKLFFIGIAIILVACSPSPEADGKKAYQKFDDCETEFHKNLTKESQRFVSNFAGFGFTTRIEAREKSEAVLEGVVRSFESCNQRAEQDYTKLKSKYVGHREKTEKFDYAYNASRSFNKSKLTFELPNQDEINKLILGIIPSKPNLEKIRTDLAGRRIREQPDGYRPQTWSLEIKRDEIKEIEIINERKQGDDYLFEVRMILQGAGGANEALINIKYILRQNDDWTIDFLESKQLNVVKTGKYDNCIKIERGYNNEGLGFFNHCDVALAVGGVVFVKRDRQWRKFYTVVDGNNKYAKSWYDLDFFSPSISDFKIHFIERP